ncbi:MAG: carbohydrate kinase [Saprospiraceae bacterium]|nr:carbohydrate kinase [Saprospiraceae bacterium]
MLLLGYDVGSSSIKASLVDSTTGATVGVAQHPEQELGMISHQAGWAEQNPATWWDCICKATQKLLQQTGAKAEDIGAIGIAYQMHGLVVVDDQQEVLRPSIIWCDSRAVQIGDEAFDKIGAEQSLQHLLNSPGNFTASKLKWVKDNEPELYRKIAHIMLPGDYIAMKLTGEVNTTISGLSEGILWDFKENDVAQLVLDQYGIDRSLIPTIVPTISIQGKLTTKAAAETGLTPGIPVTYRAGDQPNNALALNVFEPGEVAGTGGTSGVIYAVVDQAVYDQHSRVNGFAHVNYTKENPRIGILLCINGAGIQYSWLKHQVADPKLSYPELEAQAAAVPIGADGISILPFGNGAERMLRNRDLGAHIDHLQFNRHQQAHLIRAALEGVAFSFVYGVDIIKEMGLNMDVMRVGNDNMFQSKIFAETIATLLGSRIEVMETTGATGAARAAGVAVGAFSSLQEGLGQLKLAHVYEPGDQLSAYQAAYGRWKESLMGRM